MSVLIICTIVQVDWLNKFISDMWPSLDKVISYLIIFLAYCSSVWLRVFFMYRQFVVQLEARHNLYLRSTLENFRLKQLSLRILVLELFLLQYLVSVFLGLNNLVYRILCDCKRFYWIFYLAIFHSLFWNSEFIRVEEFRLWSIPFITKHCSEICHLCSAEQTMIRLV